MATITVENYVKQIYLEQETRQGQRVPMGRVAKSLGVVPGTATTMVKALADSGLADYLPRIGVRLTEAGEELAIGMLRRHRLVELFLVQTLGLDWSEIHDEAEQLEHAISDRVLDRIDALLGRPSVDPHGDPIPNAEGEIDNRPREPLSEAVVGSAVAIARITDQQPEFLHFIETSGLKPGVVLTVEERNPAADSIRVTIKDGPSLTLGSAAAEKVLVE